MTTQKESAPSHTMEATALAVGMKTFTNILGQPVDVIKVTMQKNPSFSLKGAFQHITREGYFPHLWRGGIASYLRETSKLAYRVPLMDAAPKTAVSLRVCNEDGTPNLQTQLAAGGISGILDAAGVTLYNRVKNRQIETRAAFLPTLKTFLSSPHELGRGYLPTAGKESFSWSLFYTSYYLSQHLSGTQTLSPAALLTTSALTTAFKIAVTNPLDVAITHTQTRCPSAPPSTLWQTVQHIHHSHGYRAFMAGWAPRMIHGTVNTSVGIITMNYMQKLQRRDEGFAEKIFAEQGQDRQRAL